MSGGRPHRCHHTLWYHSRPLAVIQAFVKNLLHDSKAQMPCFCVFGYNFLLVPSDYVQNVYKVFQGCIGVFSSQPKSVNVSWVPLCEASSSLLVMHRWILPKLGNKWQKPNSYSYSCSVFLGLPTSSTAPSKTTHLWDCHSLFLQPISPNCNILCL